MRVGTKSTKRPAASQCHHCGHPLNLEQVKLPRFGLARVICGECSHQHLFSPLEIEQAQGKIKIVRYTAPAEEGLLHYVRRFLVG